MFSGLKDLSRALKDVAKDVAEAHLQHQRPACPVRAGMAVDAMDRCGKWYGAVVRCVSYGRIWVSFEGFDESFNEWIDLRSKRWAPYGTHSNHQRHHFCEGDRVDAQDRCGKWYQAQVRKVRGDEVFVSFDGWSEAQNEWIGLDSERLARLGRRTGHPTMGILKPGDRIDAEDRCGKWYTAEIEKVEKGEAWVAFDGWSKAQNEWVPVNSERIARLGTRTGHPEVGLLTPGSRVDAMDKCGKWYTAEVKKVRGAEVWMSFDGWSDAVNEWMSMQSERIAPLGTHTAHPTLGVIHVGDRVDAKDRAGTWYSAQIAEMSKGEARVSFDGWSSAQDEWLTLKSDRLAKLGTYSGKKTYQVGDRLEAMDKCGMWYRATVMCVQGNEILVKFDGWEDSIHHEWISIDSEKHRSLNEEPRPSRETPTNVEFEGSRGCATRIGPLRDNSRIDCKDKTGKWLPAVVQRMERYSMLVSFDGWSSEFDEWIEIASDRYAKLGYVSGRACVDRIRTFSGGNGEKCLQVGDRIDAKMMGFWRHATVVTVEASRIRVKFDGWEHPMHHEWISMVGGKYAKFGERVN